MAKIINVVKGTKDILPADAPMWQMLEKNALEVFSKYGYKEIRTPIFEVTELFARGVGDTTDIVNKEMYTFEKSDRSLTLRPENTAGVVRSFIENGMTRLSPPVKLWYKGPMFRYERPQAGRQRQFHQVGVEMFGVKEPAADAEVILLAVNYLKSLGLNDLEVEINSLGCPECREAYKNKIKEVLKPEFNNLCDDCKEHFAKVQEYLTKIGIPFELDPHLVRGLDYYTNTAFEIMYAPLGAQSTVCGGGRYDGLIEEVGGPATPGIGFAIGMERLLLTLKEQGLLPPVEKKRPVFIVALGDAAKTEAFSLQQQLRAKGIYAEIDTMGRSMKGQMKSANRLEADYTVIIGEEELAAGQAQVRDMATKEQVSVPIDGIVAYMETHKKG